MDALDLIQIVVKGILLGQEVLNIYHAVSPNSILDSDAVADLFEQLEIAHNHLLVQQSTAMVYESMTFWNKTQDELMSIESTSMAGTYNNDPLPPGVAALVTFPTLVSKVRGRKFIPGFGEGNTTDGLFASSTLTDMSEYGAIIAAPFIGASSALPWEFGVPLTGGGFANFSSYIARNVPAYQRRRKQGVGA